MFKIRYSTPYRSKSSNKDSVLYSNFKVEGLDSSESSRVSSTIQNAPITNGARYIVLPSIHAETGDVIYEHSYRLCIRRNLEDMFWESLPEHEDIKDHEYSDITQATKLPVDVVESDQPLAFLGQRKLRTKSQHVAYTEYYLMSVDLQTFKLDKTIASGSNSPKMLEYFYTLRNRFYEDKRNINFFKLKKPLIQMEHTLEDIGTNSEWFLYSNNTSKWKRCPIRINSIKRRAGEDFYSLWTKSFS